MNYFTQLSAEVLAYYRKFSNKDVSREQFNKTAFLADYSNDKLSNEQALQVLNKLDYSSRKKLYKQVLDGIDPINPTEKMLDLLELLDPDETYFQE
jgi:5'-deoxynucleotidase YfbR-like HD superfamily hydrolase